MPNNVLRVRRAASVALLLAGALQGWVFRHTVSPDGIAYLDLSDSVVAGRPAELVNAYWSPLYPALVGLLRVAVSLTPLGSPYWEFTLVHLASFLAFALSLAAFEWFLRAVDDESANWGDSEPPFASPLGLAAAYLLFGVTSLGMISVAGTVPDFLVSAAVFSSFACLFRLQRNPGDGRASTRLGLALGLGALAKAFVFPLAIVVLVTLTAAIGRRGGRAAVLQALGVFVLVTAPWVLALSIHEGQVTVGRTGSLNYAWYVEGQQPPNSGAIPALAVSGDSLPLQGVAVLRNARGTNPMWYDPVRWHRDVRVEFSVSKQWTRLSHSLRYYLYIAGPLLLAIVAIGAGAATRDVAVTLWRTFIVLAPSVAALAAYALTYTLSRLIAPFFLAIGLVLAAAFPREAVLRRAPFSIAFGLCLFAIHAAAPPALRSAVTVSYSLALFIVPWVALRSTNPKSRWGASVAALLVYWLLPLSSAFEAGVVSCALAVLIWLALRRSDGIAGTAVAVRRALACGAIIAFSVPSVGFVLKAVKRVFDAPPTDVHPDWVTAQRLIRGGTPQGARIALLGNPDNAGWARLARYQIVAVVPDDQVAAFGRLSDADRARVMRAFSQAGATRLVALPIR